MISKHRHRSGFTIRDLLMLTFIVAALSFCLIPWGGMGHREASRRMQCSYNLKMIALAIHNYHDTYRHFPSPVFEADWGPGGVSGSKPYFSGVIELLPFLDEPEPDLFEQVMYPDRLGRPYLPPPSDKTFAPWQTTPYRLSCPTATDGRRGQGSTNYAFCLGDAAYDIHHMNPAQGDYAPGSRGAFAPGLSMEFRDIFDGTSNTIMFTEIGTAQSRYVPGQFAVNLSSAVLDNPSLCLKTFEAAKPKNNKNRTYRRDVPLHDHGRGYSWADGRAGPALVNTIFPPNGPSCAIGGTEGVDGFYSAGSYHPGGAQVAFMDGSVQFIPEDIDTGDLTQPPPKQGQYRFKPSISPYGVWGALGSRYGEEKVSRDFWKKDTK
ncbi:DUF1559 domain-containing protein [Blastopirellula marina]|uniref:DUF1559 domain-containing protein n=1 Tax=Blastopirellula marina TaxID=124 RepID=A0A2S8FHL2_9BACT|nr:DUF1559 domain-containing protein [Blastopirellula marina]PQO31657.1 hypothetical protein C5Y98_19775 [Blastopirellula marina]PTL42964.1 DUF1559 domain-containing protein [Blastopirellula marina]